MGIKTNERRTTLTVDTTIAAPPRQWRTWLLVGAAVLAAGKVAAVLVFAIGTGTKKTASSRPARATPASMVPQVSAIVSVLTPARLADGALGLGYALPNVQRGPTIASVLASMTPETRRYTKAIMSLTFAQLAAGAAGAP